MKFNEQFTSVTETYVNYNLYLPVIVIRYRGVVQIHHGMGEYSGRYERFANYLANEGYVVVVADFPGHGTSLRNFEQGSFGVGEPNNTLVEDMHHLREIISKRYPDLPYYIMGNQLGSLVARKYLSEYGDFIQGAILMGTSGKPRYLFYKKFRIELRKFLRGKSHRSKSLRKKLLEEYNTNFRPIKTHVDYLTNDPQERKRYLEDTLTDFNYPLKSHRQILSLLKEVNDDSLIELTPKHLSLLLISGKKDYFGQMGEGPKWLFEKYKQIKMYDVALKLYEDDRQDLLHELNRRQVYSDIVEWLNERTFL